MEDLKRKVDEMEGRMNGCKDDLHERITHIENGHLSKLTRLETQMEATMKLLVDFVTKAQFEPVKLIAYGLAGGVLLTVLAALLARVVIK